MKSRKLLLLIPFLLCACDSNDHTMVFDEAMTLDYGSERNTITLIKKVGNKEITDDMYDIENNMLVVGNWQVEAEVIDTTVLGSVTVLYTTSDATEHEFRYTVKVADTSAPEITFKKDVIEVYKDELDSLDIDGNINITDNYDSYEDLSIVVDGDISNVEENKDYEITVQATDTSKNTAAQSFIIRIKPEPTPTPIPTPIPEIQNNNEVSSSNSSSGSNNNQNYQSNNNSGYVAPAQPSVTAENRIFYTQDYNYDLYALESAVIAYGDSCLNAGQASGYRYAPYVADGVVVGYEITFN